MINCINTPLLCANFKEVLCSTTIGLAFIIGLFIGYIGSK